MICPHCSANIPDKSVFCGKCGKRLSLPSANLSPKEPSSSNNQESDLQLDNTKIEDNIAAELDDLVEQIAVSKPNEDTGISSMLKESNGNLSKLPIEIPSTFRDNELISFPIF